MPRYILDLHVTPRTYIQDDREADEDYAIENESEKDIGRVPHEKRELMYSFLNSQNGCKKMVEAGDPVSVPDEKQFSWINQGLEELRSMEAKSYSYDHGDDHFVQVLNAKAPNIQETSELLEEVVELEADLKGKLKHLSDFKDELREFGKLLKATPSR